MSKIYKNISELIGRTPLLELSAIEEKYNLKAKLLAKLEYFNPAGSAKDRVAKQIIEDAEKSGVLKKGSVIIEPTSGNTGIGLSMIGVNRGYRTIIVMPDTMSVERRKLMLAYGAELVLSDGSLGMSGAIAKAKELAEKIPNSFIPNQFANPSNSRSHYETTGPEIFDDTDGRVDLFVAGVGTGGTVTGVGRFLKEHCKNIKIVAVEPKNSPVLSEGHAGKHGIQGIGAGFVPEVLDREILDGVMTVSDDDAYFFARDVSKTEGDLVGISSGAALSAAVELAKMPENNGKTIVVLLPDGGERYLSTKLFGEEN